MKQVLDACEGADEDDSSDVVPANMDTSQVSKQRLYQEMGVSENR